MKKVTAGRGVTDYYLAQTRRGLVDYYLPEPDLEASRDGDEPARLTAPGSVWWGGGAAALELAGPVARDAFEPLYAQGVRPDGSRLGTRFRTDEQAGASRAAEIAATGQIADPYDEWHARHELRRSGPKPSVAAWDCTFSPVKSVSLLWAAGDRAVQQQVWAAHLSAVDAGLDYLEENAGYVRAGRDGVKVLDTSGLVVARMNEWSSRDGDMQLHTHCLVLNRAETIVDGKWRALDGRALLAAKPGASAVYNRVLEAELTRRLDVAWRARPDGLRELDGVDDGLIVAFSSRRRTIVTEVARMVAAYEAEHGVAPSRRTVSAMAQHATLATRRTKEGLDPQQAQERWTEVARAQGRELAALPHQVVGRSRDASDGAPVKPEALIVEVLARLADCGRATFSRHEVLRAALDVIPPGNATATDVRDAGQLLADRVLEHPEVLTITPPDMLEAPDGLRRHDGSSIYDRPDRQRFALHATVDREEWLLEVAAERCGLRAEPHTVADAARRHGLGDDQSAAVDRLLGDNRRVGLLVGPAGTGKTRTLRAVVDAWRACGRQAVGLTVSQAAAEVLASEAGVPAENTLKWLHETRRGRWQLPQQALVLIDEASMVSTVELVEIVEQARRAHAKVLLIGDPAQLDAIDVGGAFDLLAGRHGVAQLTDVRRFTDAWEAAAGLKLRARDPAAIADYAMRGRIHGGPTGEIAAALFDAWTADALGVDQHGDRPSVLMIAATNEQAAELSARARRALLDAQAVSSGPTVQLTDNVASVGDHIVTRRNDRRLRTSSRGWVVNGDLWTVLKVYPDGVADARRHSDGSTITLPANYLADHTHLAYATTAHRAQGLTVDRAHALVTSEVSHDQLYVSATRGRHANHLWVATDTGHHGQPEPDGLPAPEQILADVLRRKDTHRRSAHQAIADAHFDTGSLARLGVIFEDATRNATETWLQTTLRRRSIHAYPAPAADDPKWPSLIARIRALAIDGHDVPTLLDDAIRLRPLDDAQSIAGVLHWRLGLLAGHQRVDRIPAAGWLPPDNDDPHVIVARQADLLIRHRWEELHASCATRDSAPRWAEPLGDRPADAEQADLWIAALTAIAAYRERYALADHTPMLGRRPSEIRPDAQAAHDQARRLADRHLARRLDHLDPQQLRELDARQRAVLDARPTFDPAKLKTARRALDAAERAERLTPADRRDDVTATRIRAARRVARLERRADAYEDWKRHAHGAFEVRRLIAQMASRREPVRREPVRQLVRR